MRHLLVAGAALVLGLFAWTAHPSEAGARAQRVGPRSPMAETPSTAQAAVLRLEEPRVVSQSNLAALPPGPGKQAGPADVRHARMQAETLALLQRELGLLADQSSHIAAVFRDRQLEIDAYHRELRASGIFRQKDYDRRIGDIRVTHYARMAAFMDSRQARRFQELIYGGSFGDGIFFDIDPNMVVIE